MTTYDRECPPFLFSFEKCYHLCIELFLLGGGYNFWICHFYLHFYDQILGGTEMSDPSFKTSDFLFLLVLLSALSWSFGCTLFSMISFLPITFILRVWNLKYLVIRWIVSYHVKAFRLIVPLIWRREPKAWTNGYAYSPRFWRLYFYPQSLGHTP